MQKLVRLNGWVLPIHKKLLKGESKKTGLSESQIVREMIDSKYGIISKKK